MIELNGKYTDAKIMIDKMRKSKEGLKNPNGKKYMFISPDGIEYVVDGKFCDFCTEHHLWHNAMSKVHRGLKESHKGWKCFIIEKDVNS